MSTIVSGQVGVAPDGTAVMRYLVNVAMVVFCAETGQLVSLGVFQLTPLVVTTDVMVVVVRSCRFSSVGIIVACAAFDLPDEAHMFGIVVVKIAIDFVDD